MDYPWVILGFTVDFVSFYLKSVKLRYSYGIVTAWNGPKEPLNPLPTYIGINCLDLKTQNMKWQPNQLFN